MQGPVPSWGSVCLVARPRQSDQTRGVSHVITRALREAIEACIHATNYKPTPFWIKSADEILASVARFCAHSLAGANS
jgi:hypothetical protein